MNRPRDYHTKQSKPDKGRQISYITYKWNLKKNCTDELIYKTEIDPHTQKTNMITKRERGGRIN